MNIEEIKELMDNFDPAALLPDLSSVVGKVELAMDIVVLVGPVLLLVLGLLYFFAAPREANHYFGYRCFFGMGSVEAWRFTQRLAGAVWGIMGLILTPVMWFLSKDFGGLETMEMVWKAVRCVLWQAGLVAVSCVVLNLVVMIRFNYKGEPRRTRRRKSELQKTE